jgi:HSP20 family protein
LNILFINNLKKEVKMVPVKTNSNWLPSIFNDFFENEWLAKTGVTAPAINVIENDKDYKVEMAAPGMTKDPDRHPEWCSEARPRLSSSSGRLFSHR